MMPVPDKKALLKTGHICLLVLSLQILSGQDKGIDDRFMDAEMANWQEYIRHYDRFTGTENLDVTYYHLELDIAIDSPYLSGSARIRFTPAATPLSRIRLDCTGTSQCPGSAAIHLDISTRVTACSSISTMNSLPETPVR